MRDNTNDQRRQRGSRRSDVKGCWRWRKLLCFLKPIRTLCFLVHELTVALFTLHYFVRTWLCCSRFAGTAPYVFVVFVSA